METIQEKKSKDVFIQFFSVPIYSSKVCFIRFKNRKGWNEAISYLNKLGVVTDEINTDEWMFAYGFTTKEKTTKYGYVHFVFISGAQEYLKEYTDTLSHEVYHLIENISTHHGIKHEEGEANEPQAYLTGYIFNYLTKL